MSKPVTVEDLRTARRVLKYIIKDMKKSESYNNAVGKTTESIVTVLIHHTVNLEDQVREERKKRD